MKNFFIILAVLFFIAPDVSAHSGRTDSCGGHNDRKHGGYHVHNHSKYCSCYPDVPECKQEKVATDKAKGLSKGIPPTDEWTCPETHPIKGNINIQAGTMIYHLPGGAYYNRTKPEKCYATEEDAVAAGFRKPKR
ncbi:MAG: YHYH domain-containing protein [Thermodesulfobacteriota bacterium]